MLLSRAQRMKLKFLSSGTVNNSINDEEGEHMMGSFELVSMFLSDQTGSLNLASCIPQYKKQ